jgi:hypothetical protein
MHILGVAWDGFVLQVSLLCSEISNKRTAMVRATATADSSAALRNDNKKDRQLQLQLQLQPQIPPLRCGMTTRGQSTAKIRCDGEGS